MTGLRVILAMGLIVVSTGCQAIGTIFEAGMWVGMIAVLLVLGLVAALVVALRRPKPPAA